MKRPSVASHLHLHRVSYALFHHYLSSRQACINQTDIAANLQALPIFLSGCKELVVLAGLSYPTRLWCVVELFVFIRMGGERDCLRVYELGTISDSETKAAVHSSLMRFDASKAQCFLTRDRHHLLAVIESGFGDCKPFNAIVRNIFCEALGLPARTTEERKAKGTSRGRWSGARILPYRTKQAT